MCETSRDEELRALLREEIENLTPEELLSDLMNVGELGDTVLSRALFPELYYGKLNIFGEGARSLDSLTTEERAAVEDIICSKTR